MSNFYRYPSIEQFRNVVRAVTDHVRFAGKDENGKAIYNNNVLPTLTFTGTTKIHGTCSAIVAHDRNGTFTFQSRERILSLEQDNAGFMMFMEGKKDILQGIVYAIENNIHEYMDENNEDSIDKIAIFGEYAGGNIQKGVAVTGLEKFFTIFGIKLIRKNETEEWLDLAELPHIHANDHRIFNIFQFGKWSIDIDFNNPQESQNKLVELTDQVEQECPVGKFFGVSGIGEGIVWHCQFDNKFFQFKVKGSEHANSKVKTLASVDPEVYTKINTFIQDTVTENRLQQGLTILINELQKPFDMTSVGEFIKWVTQDVMREERDTIVANQLDMKKLPSAIANVSRQWYSKKLDAQIMKGLS